MKQRDKTHCKYVFVCGLHRSGTSVLARNIGRLQDCTGFENTGAVMDEGQFLQDVYPVDVMYGGVGAFAFDRRAHLTEASSLLTPENIAKLRADWHKHWHQDKKICIEKTPANILMTRFLQAAFPESYFIVIKRHPVPVSIASQQWKINIKPVHRLFEHWLHCHAIFEEDKKYLKHVYELRYEDYIENQTKCHEEIAAFIGTHVPEDGFESATGAHNKRYFRYWSDRLNRSAFKCYYRYVAIQYEPRFRRYGYSLIQGFAVDEKRLQATERVSYASGALYYQMADASALTARLGARLKGYLRRQVRACLSERMKATIKHLLRRNLLNRKQREITAS